ncbi:MAG: MFS transporter [Clostridia bacterium]|nr:MFS transporter [Clostridia bacterium]
MSEAFAINQNPAQANNKSNSMLSNSRRYVGSKESAAYVIYDISQSFNINKYQDIFITDVVQIGLSFQTIVTFVIGIWDVINDVFLAAIVDKTRTRFGKFRPWLFICSGPGYLLSLVYWLLPIIFAGTSPYNAGKLAFYMIFQLISNLNGSLCNISRTGMLSTITPNVIERTRLITQASLFSGFIEKWPEIFMGLLIDLINHGKLKIPMKGLYVSAGIFTSTAVSIMGLYFVFTAKERVAQRIEKPSVIQGIKSILNNKPLLILTITDFLTAFGMNSGVNYYYINVLGFASMTTIVGIPGAFVSPTSYAFVTKARERFSTRFLWILSSHFGDFLMIFVYLIGSINKNYKKLAVMIPAFMIRETIWMTCWGLMNVIPEEMRNETIDYGEWKNGYRTEGMTGVAKDLARKLVGTLGASIKAYILSKIGYVEGAGYGNQSEKTEYLLFMMCTLLPTVTSVFGLIPKFFYDLSGEKKEIMYQELAERRRSIIKQMNEISPAENNEAQTDN